MAGNVPPIYRFEESLRNQGICTKYRPRPARSRRGKSDRCVTTRPGVYFFLEEIQLSGPIQEAIGQFVAARQLSGNPIAVSLWKRDPEWDLVNKVD
jgi:hypothetical protein